MKKTLIVAATVVGALLARRKLEQQRAEKDLYAAAEAGQSRQRGKPVGAREAWAAATDTRP